MKKIVLTLGILLSGVSIISVNANPIQTSAAQNAEASSRLESIKKNCNPTPDQLTKLKSILNDYETTKAADEKANKGNAAGLQEANKKNSYDFNQKLHKVLTPEQMKSLNAADAAWAREHDKKTK